ncbi:hypothetical protein [Nocardia paucivorans]|uniref:hypothetical protein n=1 Tax=Nocardia paucivorans TaxID=114259 RepID=UPI0002E382E0|nr:hypothetical protein [Nocardia paucivorans]
MASGARALLLVVCIANSSSQPAGRILLIDHVTAADLKIERSCSPWGCRGDDENDTLDASRHIDTAHVA